MIVEKQMECRLAGETEVLEENLPKRHFCLSQNPTCLDPGLKPGRRGGKPVTNRLSYGGAQPTNYIRVTDSFLRSHESLDHSRISPHFMEPKISLPYSHGPTIFALLKIIKFNKAFSNQVSVSIRKCYLLVGT
jgi:hypothetical protein